MNPKCSGDFLTQPSPYRLPTRALALVLLSGTAFTAAQSQTPQQIVQWHTTLNLPSPLKPGQTVIVELTGEILDGWHVYALKQRPGGPTELRAGVDDNDVAQLTGAPTGTKVEKRRDPRFGVETQYYSGSFTLHLPVQVKQLSGSGRQQFPLSVRFQSCSDSLCLPPTTVHVPVELEVKPHA